MKVVGSRMAVEREVREAYRRMVERIPAMDSAELDDLRRDLEAHDPGGKYSWDVQAAIEAELGIRYLES
jgi:hypothetical protein